MNKECSTCYYCQWNLLQHDYVCENENSSEYGTEIDWLDGVCDGWTNDKEEKQMVKEEAIDIVKCLAWHARPDEEQIEQAIKALEQQTNDCKIFGTKENCFGGATENECEHCDYKIQKLEQYPSDDCVSREQAVKAMTDWYFDMLEKGEGKDFINILDALPPVTPTQSWIPVSERLPKEDDDYLVTISTDIGAKEPVREVYKDFFCILSQQWLYYTEDVIAWQPLPKPYEEKRGSENEVD